MVRTDSSDDFFNQVSLDTVEPIVGGTSGGPVVNDDGELLGLISQSAGGDAEGGPEGMMPVVAFALPHWVLARIARGTVRS